MNSLKLLLCPYNSWRQFIDSEEDQKTLDNIREHTLPGRSLGAIIFIEKLEKIFNRRLIPLPRVDQKGNRNKWLLSLLVLIHIIPRVWLKLAMKY